MVKQPIYHRLKELISIPRKSRRGTKLEEELYNLVNTIIEGDKSVALIGDPTKNSFKEYNHYSNGEFVYIPELNGNILIDGYKKYKNKIKSYKRNYMMLNILFEIGGGEANMALSTLEYRRAGGSTQDLLNNILNYYPRTDSDYKFIRSNTTYKQMLFGHFVGKILTFNEIVLNLKVNFSASAGYMFKRMGYYKKNEAINLAGAMFRVMYDDWISTPNSELCPFEIWEVGSRPRLDTDLNIAVKARSHQPVGRSISICSFLEPMIASPLYLIVKRLANIIRIECNGPIMIGINKFSKDWTKLIEELEKFDYIFSLDVSKFDQSTLVMLLRKSFNIIFKCFNMNDTSTYNYITNYKRWLEKNFYKRYYCIQDQIDVQTFNGMPSGSNWTSLLDSIILYVVVSEYFASKQIDYTFKSFGDDGIGGFSTKEDKDTIIKGLITFLQLNFGYKCDPEQTIVVNSENARCIYRRPIYSPGDYLSKGTRDLIPLFYEYLDEEPTKWNHNEGSTHRYEIVFKDRPSFLSHYWTKEGKAVRSSFETVNRLVNPEEHHSNPIELKISMQSHMADNYNNPLMRNKFYHYFYDLIHLTDLYDFNKKQFKCGALYTKRNIQKFALLRKIEKKPGQRAWYRRVDEYIDLDNHENMTLFNRKWKRMMKECEDLRSALTKIEPYDTKRSFMSSLIKDDQVKDFIMNKFIREKDYEGFIDRYCKLNEEGFNTNQIMIDNAFAIYIKRKYKKNHLYNFIRSLKDKQSIDEFLKEFNTYKNKYKSEIFKNETTIISNLIDTLQTSCLNISKCLS